VTGLRTGDAKRKAPSRLRPLLPRTQCCSSGPSSCAIALENHGIAALVGMDIPWIDSKRSDIRDSIQGSSIKDKGQGTQDQFPVSNLPEILMKVSIVIPAYNEEQAVGSVIAKLQDLLRRRGIEAEIIVVDDGSADQTAQGATDESQIATSTPFHERVILCKYDAKLA